MFKVHIILPVLCFVLAFSVNAGNKLHHSYKTPVEVDAIGFEAKSQNGSVVTTWKEYLRNDLKYYKVVKSNSNSSPLYPEDGYIYYSKDASSTSYVDNKTSPGTWYYRLCIITKNNDRWVSPVVKVLVKENSSGVPSKKDFK